MRFVLLLSIMSAAHAASPGTPDARRAKGYLNAVCGIGPRASGSAGMAAQQKLLTEHFTKLGGKVRMQEFDVAHPLSGRPVRMANMIVSWHPAATERVLIACHYDTRPYPDRDRRSPRGRFIGANDGASGVAMLMEMAHHVRTLKPTCGVDFVLFDGEELIYVEQRRFDRIQHGEFFHGSKYFAKQYRDRPPAYRYRCGVLVDMIGDRDLQLFIEGHSLRLAPEVTRSVWAVAAKLRVREFVARERHSLQDDHIPLNETARIPTCNIVDFDYRWWHTTQDLPSKCSGGSLAKVARVLLAWLEGVPELKGGGRRKD